MDKIYFVHIMKTGGTSFRQMLTEEYKRKSIYPNGNDLDSFPNRWYPKAEWVAENINVLRNHKVLVGHYPYSLRNSLGEYKCVTVIRDPYKRTLSMLGHKLKKTKDPTVTIEKLLNNESFVSKQILNYQTKVLGMPLGEVNIVDIVTDETFSNAKDNIRHLDFIGINEYFSESCFLYDHRFGTSLVDKIRHDNKAKRSLDVSVEIKKKIEGLIEMDVELYDLALKRFRSELESINSK